MSAAWTRLQELRSADPAAGGDRVLSHGVDPGLPEVDRLAADALAAYAHSNGLDPTAFPSLVQMENELVGFACDLLDAPPTVVGTVTAGSGESALLTLRAARDARAWVESPTVVLPETAHPAFRQAATYLDVEPVVVPVDDDQRAPVGATAAAIDRSTVLAVASAPSYAHGVVDPIGWIAAAAAARRVPLHVDAGLGGWALAYAERVGRFVPTWTFTVPGVSSISMDLHTHAHSPAGASLLLFRDAEGRRPTYHASASWPGPPMVATTSAFPRAGGPLAAAWVTVQEIGHDGYAALARDCLDATDLVIAGVATIEGLKVATAPDGPLLALRTDASCDVFTVADELIAQGWATHTQPSWQGRPATLHLTLGAGTLPVVEELTAALREAVARAREAGPVRVDPAVAARMARLHADYLSDADVDDLLRLAGLAAEAGPVALPKALAPVGALVDAAPPALREVVLAAYADRLYRPVRATIGVA